MAETSWMGDVCSYGDVESDQGLSSRQPQRLRQSAGRWPHGTQHCGYGTRQVLAKVQARSLDVMIAILASSCQCHPVACHRSRRDVLSLLRRFAWADAFLRADNENKGPETKVCAVKIVSNQNTNWTRCCDNASSRRSTQITADVEQSFFKQESTELSLKS